MAKMKLEQGLEFEHEDGGEYVLRFKAPQIKLPSDLTGGHLKEARKEVLLAVRSLIDKAINVAEEKDKG
ncbi:MAG: hypothetical protein WC370_01975 [Dehalococcoidales bacterium]|jgi:hypothetical protein